MKSHFSVFCLNLISLNGSSVFFSLLESIICLLRSITMPKRDLYVDQLKRMWRGSNNLWEFGHRLEQPQLPLRIVAACAWTRHFSNQGSVLDYFTCCLFQETNTAFQIQILVFSMVSSYVQHLWVWAKGLCNGQVIVTSSTLFPYVFFFLYNSFSCSLQLLLVSYLSLSLHLSSKFLSMALHFYASCLFTNILHTESCLFQFHHDNLFTSFFLEWCFSSAWSFSDLLCLPDCAFRIQMDFPGSTFRVMFPHHSEFSTLGTWLSDSHHTPLVLQSL